MTSNEPDCTISESREESLLKALNLLQSSTEPPKPLVRPDIPTVKTLIRWLLWVLLALFVTVIIFLLGRLLHLPLLCVRTVAFLFWVALFALKAKSLICSAVLLYQKHAPEKIRRACVFTPTCSEYMLLAIEKHGVFKGFFKGINRLARCHHPNGGEDLP